VGDYARMARLTDEELTEIEVPAEGQPKTCGYVNPRLASYRFAPCDRPAGHDGLHSSVSLP
jgi:hypothetical protein